MHDTPSPPARQPSARRAVLAAVTAVALLLTGCGAACAGSSSEPTPAAEPPSPAQVPFDAAARPVTVPTVEALLAEIGDGLRQSMGVYMLGRKVGFAHSTLEPLRDGDALAGFRQKTALRLTVVGPAGSARMTLDEVRDYGPRPPYPLIRTTYSESSPIRTSAREAVARPGALVVTRSGEPPRTLPPTGERLPDLLSTAPLDVGALAVGDIVVATHFDWEREADDRIRTEVRSLSEARRNGVPVTVAELVSVTERAGFESVSRVAHGGQMLEARVGAALTMRLEERGVAESDVVGLDVLGATVEVPTELGAPGRVLGLELEVEVAEPVRLDALPSSPRQRVTTVEGQPRALRVSLRADEDGGAVGEAERTAALVPEPALDSDHPEVRALAERLIADAPGDRAKVRVLADWVHRSLDKALATHIPSASGVIAEKVGDCTEHTWAFVALARAAGVPARPVYGLASLGSTPSRLGYHAWAEVALGGRWVAVDPTWGPLGAEWPADATHVAFGSDSGGTARLLGALTVRSARVTEMR